MKKLSCFVLSLILVLLVPLCAFAQGGVVVSSQAPTLKSISFKNANIEGAFTPHKYEYNLTLTDPSVTPTLNDYKIQGEADIFVTYNTELSGRQTGVIVTLKFANGSVIYTFNYLNSNQNSVNANNNLSVVQCELCEVYPALNQNETEYTLYIPSDLTEINLSVATEDVGAHCTVPGTITLNDEQELDIPLTVVASDSTAKTYTFSVKRLDKTCEEVKAQMAEPDFTSLVEEHMTVQRAEIAIVVGCVVVGLIALAVFVKFAKCLTVRVYDSDEKEFFDQEIVYEDDIEE